MYSSNKIKQKEILFFAPSFFGYEQKIKKKMEEMGARVEFYDERSVSTAFNRALLKVCPNIFLSKSIKYYHCILKRCKREYDYILFIKADMVPIVVLKEIRERYKNAKLFLYLYDSIKNIPGILDKLKYFDFAYSFDKNDCMKYSMLEFRPLFFADEFRNSIEKDFYKYDISFYGTIHSDRYKIIEKIIKICKDCSYEFYWFGYLQSKFIYYLYKLIKKEYKNTKVSTFHYEKMNSKDITRIVEDSKIILDIQHPLQSGLTMRTIEMIGMKKKIITTNKEILDYDFYCPENIYIIDRNNIVIDNAFLTMPYRTIDENIYEKYSLDRWVLDVLDINK